MFEAQVFFGLGVMQCDYLYGRHLATNRQFQYPPQDQQTGQRCVQDRQGGELGELIRRQAELAKNRPDQK